MENKSFIKLSVHLVTYNHENTIEQCLDSILKQKVNFEYEIVVGEDCSTDRTREILNEYKKKYPTKINLIYRDKNIGLIKNALDTFLHCKGKYIALIEGDDYWIDENKLQKQIDILDNYKNISLVHTEFDKLLVEQGKIIKNFYSSEKISLKKIFNKEDYLKDTFIRLSTVCFKKEEMAGFFEFMKNKKYLTYDVPLFLWLLRNKNGYYLRNSTTLYREFNESISHSKNLNKICKFNCSFVDVHYYFYSKIYKLKDKKLEKFILKRQYDVIYFCSLFSNECNNLLSSLFYKIKTLNFTKLDLIRLLAYIKNKVFCK